MNSSVVALAYRQRYNVWGLTDKSGQCIRGNRHWNSGRPWRAVRIMVIVGLIAIASGQDTQDTGTAEVRPEFWKAYVQSGVLAEGYLDRIDCVGSAFNKLRDRFGDHIRRRMWDMGYGYSQYTEELWVSEPSTWQMVKAAEEILEIWRRTDLGVKGAGSVKETLMTMQRAIHGNTVAVVDVAMAATLMASHLEQIAEESAPAPKGLAASCFPGFLVAILIFGRALAVLGASNPTASDDDDGFLLWRKEHGYLLEELFIGEGASIVDLFQAPGWPDVDSCFVEQMLHVPSEEQSDNPKALQGGAGGDALVKLGRLRQVVQPKPLRLPTPERYHRATDPMGVSSWGNTVVKWMTQREDVVQASLAIRMPPPWSKVGPAWVTRNLIGNNFNPSRRVRLLAFISQHGALDLEMPELVLALFPELVEGQFFLGGVNKKAICGKGEGSETIAQLCSEFIREFGAEALAKASGATTPPPGGREKLFDGRALPDVNDPRLYFTVEATGQGSRQRHLPDIVMLSSFVEAIWVRRHFPEMPLIVYFGPPLLLDVGMDMEPAEKDGGGTRGPVAKEFWDGIYDVLKCSNRGSCMIASESLFRSEQFFYQTGVEVPFLRPMSVWVNATYNPRARRRDDSDQSPRHEVLVHNRGRLKYEVHFVNALQNLAGPAFPFRIASQDGQIIPFSQLATYHAVVIVPWSPEICMLRHLFKMRVPLFVPDRSLLRNLVHVSNRRLMPYPYHLPMPGSNRRVIEELHPYDPFWDTTRRPADPRGIEARIYWAEYSEYLLLPMLQYFSSAASLMIGLHEMDGQKVSARMRKVYLEDMEEMHSYWSTSLKRMMQHV